MTRHLLTALCAALVIYGGVFYAAIRILDCDIEADW